MLSELKLWNFKHGVNFTTEDPSAFRLNTCQRSLCLSFNDNNLSQQIPQNIFLQGKAAYLFLLETICGLQSKLIGESEIVSQFKTAYQEYLTQINRDPKIMKVLEKLFQDAKEIRTRYLIGIAQKTYSSLTRRHFINQYKADHIVILGSGQLALDLIYQLKKKSELTICARDPFKAQDLAKRHSVRYLPWQKLNDLSNFPFIANTIGFDGILLDQRFFDHWCQKHTSKLFVDLGSPSCIQTHFNSQNDLLKLDDIFEQGAVVESQKEQQIQMAKSAMSDMVQKRFTLFQEKKSTSETFYSRQSSSLMRYV